MVGTGEDHLYPRTQLNLWDASEQKVVGKVKFQPDKPIRDLIVLGDWILVVFGNCTRIFNFIHGFSEDKCTVINHGEVSAPNQGKIACQLVGDTLMVANETPYKDEIGTFELCQLSPNFELTRPRAIPSGSKTAICGLTFSQNGNNLVFATDSGTMIRVYSLTSNSFIHEFCRGRNPAAINSISANESFISCTSDHGTTHIFKAFAPTPTQSQLASSKVSTEETKVATPGNTKSILSMVPLLGSRFNTEYAFTKINREQAEEGGELCWLSDDRAIIVTMRGNYKQY
jgi:WD40 repeat protein